MTTTTAVPFGKHRGQPLADVPASYLAWLLTSCKLSSGLRGTVAGELSRRGVTPPAPPPPPPTPSCWKCGSAAVRFDWYEDRIGRRQIRRTCQRCGGSLGFAPLAPELIELADKAASAAPLLDVLITCDRLGIRLANDGGAVDFQTADDWRRAPDDLRRQLRQCRHSLAKLLPQGTT